MSDAQKRFIGLIVVLAATVFAYRMLYTTGDERTAGLFVGVPALLAIGLASLPKSRSATGIVFRGASLAMLLVCVVLPEGTVCLLFALPLAGVIALIVGGTYDLLRKRGIGDGPALMAVGLPLLILSAEGIVGSPFNANDAAESSVVVSASTEEVRALLARPAAFHNDLPLVLALGFDKPVAATGGGIETGDRRTIAFAGSRLSDRPLDAITGRGSGASRRTKMELQVSDVAPNSITFDLIEDTTMMSRWVDIRRAKVSFEPSGSGTLVTWRLEYERLLHPTLYFAPLQRYAMGEAAAYLLDALIVRHT